VFPWPSPLPGRDEPNHGVRVIAAAPFPLAEGERFLRVLAAPWPDESGQPGTRLAILQDLTAQLAREREQHQARKLEAVGRLAAGLAHEMNTPLQYLGSNIHFLKEAFRDLTVIWTMVAPLLHAVKQCEPTTELVRDLEAALEEVGLPFLFEEIPETLEQSRDGIGQIGMIVRAMREFARPPEKGKVPTDINQALRNTLTVSRNEWKYVAETTTDFAPDLPLLPCLAGEIHQAFFNLVVNSAQAIAAATTSGDSRGKGLIRLTTRLRGDRLEIRIGDTGGGIPAAVRDRIFDPFYTTREEGRGMGQGLTIARSIIVDKHQGSIRFETEEGIGTTFIVDLPLNDSASCRVAHKK